MSLDALRGFDMFWIVGGREIVAVAAATSGRLLSGRSHSKQNPTAAPIATLLVFNAWPTYAAGLVAGTIPLLPDEAAGTIMVFKLFDEIGYGLVMEATQAIHIHDYVRNPS